jgi:hypothetical protein
MKGVRRCAAYQHPKGFRAAGDYDRPLGLEARGRYETARRLRSTCGQVFRYGIATGRAERDPSADLRGALTAPKVKHRAAVIDPKAIGALLRAIDGYDGQPITQAALKLAPLESYVFRCR